VRKNWASLREFSREISASIEKEIKENVLKDVDEFRDFAKVKFKEKRTV
jgi:hypothetical protein